MKKIKPQKSPFNIKIFLLEEETGRSPVKTEISRHEARKLIREENDGYHLPSLSKLGEHLFYSNSDGKGWSFNRYIVQSLHRD